MQRGRETQALVSVPELWLSKLGTSRRILFTVGPKEVSQEKDCHHTCSLMQKSPTAQSAIIQADSVRGKSEI